MSRRKFGIILFGIAVACVVVIQMANNNAKPVEAAIVCSGVAEFPVTSSSHGGRLKSELDTWLSMRPDHIVDSTVVLTEWSSGYSLYRPASLLVFYHRAGCR